jgi:hypothetical protein
MHCFYEEAVFSVRITLSNHNFGYRIVIYNIILNIPIVCKTMFLSFTKYGD